MSLDEFLNKYSINMTEEEINMIDNSEIKDIKMKYRNLKYQAFIKNPFIESEYNKYCKEMEFSEQKELETLYNNTYKQM